MAIQDALNFLRKAVICSVFTQPLDPGLSQDELHECARRHGFQDGEFSDAFSRLSQTHPWDSRIKPHDAHLILWSDFNHPHDPDYRNAKAFQFVHDEMRKAAKADGAAKALLARDVLVARGVAQGLPENDLQVALTMLILVKRLIEENGSVRYAPGRDQWPGPSEQKGHPGFNARRRDEVMARAYDIVRDVVARRDDGRRRSAEPLDAFADELETLGVVHFRVWWQQLVAECRTNDENRSPVSLIVVSAALVEGAFTFAAQHFRQHDPNDPFVRNLPLEPRQWQLPDLVKRAAGGDLPILNPALRHRADQLITARQRIHAGRMLGDHPGLLPDFRPSEARDSRATAEALIQAILDWLSAKRR